MKTNRTVSCIMAALVVSCSVLLLAQPGPYTWQKIFGLEEQAGGRTEDIPSQIFNTKDGGFVMAGTLEWVLSIRHGFPPGPRHGNHQQHQGTIGPMRAIVLAAGTGSRLGEIPLQAQALYFSPDGTRLVAINPLDFTIWTTH